MVQPSIARQMYAGRLVIAAPNPARIQLPEL
jgi:hypothetical protein